MPEFNNLSDHLSFILFFNQVAKRMVNARMQPHPNTIPRWLNYHRRLLEEAIKLEPDQQCWRDYHASILDLEAAEEKSSAEFLTKLYAFTYPYETAILSAETRPREPLHHT